MSVHLHLQKNYGAYSKNVFSLSLQSIFDLVTAVISVCTECRLKQECKKKKKKTTDKSQQVPVRYLCHTMDYLFYFVCINGLDINYDRKFGKILK